MNENYNGEKLSEIPEQKKENKNIIFEDHKIELLSKEGAVEFNEEHIEKIKKVLNLFSKIGLKPAKGFSGFESVNVPDAKHRGGFPANAEIIYGAKDLDGIKFYNRGMDTSIAHRISSSENFGEEEFIDNFSGTLAHELAHGNTSGAKLFDDRKFNQEFIREWQERFGWEYIFPNIKNEKTGRWERSTNSVEGWKKDEDGFWRNNDYVVAGIEYTTMPEKCMGGKKGYAASKNWQEDICDSVAAYLLNPSVLDEEKKEFLENKFNEYKQNYKPDKEN